jgi:Coenzyme PQQ synthesis protein D (PqqD)
MTYRCCPLSFETDALLHYGQQLGLSTVEQSLQAVAAAIALHPLWQDVPQSLCIVRAEPTPVLAFLGTFSGKTLGQLSLQVPFLNQVCQRLRYVTYADATMACEQLAEQLQNTFGSKSLQEFQFYGVPRGGLIVLGMLSYMLGLRSEQLNPAVLTPAPLVVVDDCALSGSRFYRVLQQYPHPSLILATLYSHPELRDAIATRESNVLQCLSGRDLYDHGPQTMGAGYKMWQTQNQARLAGHRYWLGLPDYICFPWNEPDHLLWNPATASLEQSWHILPPAACLKNRPACGVSLPIQVQPSVKGWLQPTEHVVFGELNGQVLIGHLPTGETFGLSGKAAAFWQVILRTEGVEAAIAQLSAQYSESNLRSDLTTLIDQLIAQQILRPSV